MRAAIGTLLFLAGCSSSPAIKPGDRIVVDGVAYKAVEACGPSHAYCVQQSVSGCLRIWRNGKPGPWDCAKSRLPKCAPTDIHPWSHYYPNSCVKDGSRGERPET